MVSAHCFVRIGLWTGKPMSRAMPAIESENDNCKYLFVVDDFQEYLHGTQLSSALTEGCNCLAQPPELRRVMAGDLSLQAVPLTAQAIQGRLLLRHHICELHHHTFSLLPQTSPVSNVRPGLLHLLRDSCLPSFARDIDISSRLYQALQVQKFQGHSYAGMASKNLPSSCMNSMNFLSLAC